MSEWKFKRFWKQATSEPAEGGFAVVLDGRPVKTPAKKALVLPSRALADALAAEWDAQGDHVDPEAMPMTRLGNSAIDKVAVQHAAVAAMLAEYGGSDLLCYRAVQPAELIARQAAAWDELLDWAAASHGITLATQTGVMPISQSQDARDKIGAITHALDAFTLTGFHELVSISGSWVIGLAALENFSAPETLWDAALVDEYFQEEQWGKDDEALEMRATKRAAFLRAHQFTELCRKA